MKKMKKWSKLMGLLCLITILSFSLAACGGGEAEEPEPEEVKVEETKQDFTTTDGKYTLTVTGVGSNLWTEAVEYTNAEATLEIDNTINSSFVMILSQEKAGLGYTLSSYNDTVLSDMEASVESMSLEGTEDITIAGCPAKRSLFSFRLEGMGFYCYLTVIETDTEYVQLFVESLSSSPDVIKEYTDEITQTFKIN